MNREDFTSDSELPDSTSDADENQRTGLISTIKEVVVPHRTSKNNAVLQTELMGKLSHLPQKEAENVSELLCRLKFC